MSGFILLAISAIAAVVFTCLANKVEDGLLGVITYCLWIGACLTCFWLLISSFTVAIPVGDEITLKSTTVQTNFITCVVFSDFDGNGTTEILEGSKAYLSTNIAVYGQVNKNAWGMPIKTTYTCKVN